jgi:flavin reductase (DIM6/NTAB) family NADH-FMN oxidoreductase RutF
MANRYLTEAFMDTAVAILLVQTESRRNAMTISCFSEVAHYPAAIWVSVEKDSYTHELLQETNRFSLAVLNQRQVDIARACGTASGRTVDKCAGLNLRRSPAGFLFLQDALASTGAEVSRAEDMGSHTLFVGNIVEAEFCSRASTFRHLLLSDLSE